MTYFAIADTINDSTLMTLSTNAAYGYICEWEAQIMDEPTDKCRYGYKKNTFSPYIINEIGRQCIPFYLREERQSKVDAFAAMQLAGEQ